MLISTHFKENAHASRAEVLKNEAGGNKFYTETFPGKSVHFVEDAAENWALNVKVLNG